MYWQVLRMLELGVGKGRQVIKFIQQQTPVMDAEHTGYVL